MKWLALTVSIGTLATTTAPAQVSPRSYAHRLVLTRWHSQAQWQAVDAIVTPESHWNPCAYYPSRHDCAYSGVASCGLPQAQPCPLRWRGRLGRSWRAQVRWLLAYISRRYGSPSRALAFREANCRRGACWY